MDSRARNAIIMMMMMERCKVRRKNYNNVIDEHLNSAKLFYADKRRKERENEVELVLFYYTAGWSKALRVMHS